MKLTLNIRIKQFLLTGLLSIGYLGLHTQAFAAVTGPLSLTQIPLATSASTVVKPNLLLVLDNSGSMDWDHMPDDASDGGSSVPFSYGFYGLRSSQCNQVYYDPTFTYLPPIDALKADYANASFAAAKTDGFNSGSATINLNNAYKASQSLGGDAVGQSAYYYVYSGSQTTQLQKNYNDTSNTFYNECHSANGSAPGNAVFSKRRLASTETTTINVSGSSSTSVTSITVNGVQLMSAASVANSTTSTVASNIASRITLNGFSASATGSLVTISGPVSAANFTPVITQVGGMTLITDIFPDTTAAKLTNFANWYSFYHTRMLMMKTATGRAFSVLNGPDYRVGLMKISQTGTPTVEIGLFTGAKRTEWYNTLYGVVVSGSTPLRRALSEAGRYYAGQFGGTDPIQYSCQQNFSIMSTDGYWNAGDGYELDGSTPVGNQDGTAARPMNDGSQTADTVTTQYTQNSYSKVRGSCGGGQRQLRTQLETFSCGVTASVEACTGTTASGAATFGACASSASIIVPPSPSSRVAVGTPVTTTGAVGGTSDNLADIAMYYYQTDLRSGACALCEDNVFKSGIDDNKQQHMTTFTLGLGASGWMNYASSYNTGGSADFTAVKQGSTASTTTCTWQASGTVCNWPEPGMSGSEGLIANIDDLWHAAVNGRGAYFSATNPETLSSGLSNALAAVNTRKGAGAAAATSTLSPTQDNNFAFVASYSTVSWIGNLEARGINTDTGETNKNALWCVEDVASGTCRGNGTVQSVNDGNTTSAFCVIPNSDLVSCPDGVLDGTDCSVPVATACSGTLKTRVSDTTDTRLIWTKGANESTLNNFALGGTNGTLNSADFSAAKISALSQYPSLDGTQTPNATSTALVNYLRGQKGDEDNSVNPDPHRLFRSRDATLGDVIESQPQFVGAPKFNYLDSGYAAFKSTNAARSPTVYLGSNDGMLHAIDASYDATLNTPTATSGQERWAYVPSMVIPNMWKLADSAYKSNHAYYVNGSPTIADVYDDVSLSWKTILVSGLGGGGRGYFALDITNPTAPKLLWEFTTTNALDLGYSYGKPIVTKKADGKWVVLLTSGYNNTSPGDGLGHLYVLNAVKGPAVAFTKIDTTAGGTSLPSGLAHIADWVDKGDKNNSAVFVYGGDLLGNVWRFDINAATVTPFAKLCADASCASPQPITIRPELAGLSTHRLVFVGTGKFLESAPSPGFDDFTDTQLQTIYAIKDDDAVGATPTAAIINPRTFTGAGPNHMVQVIINPTTHTATSATVPNFNTDRGWYANFPGPKERENVPPQLVSGNLLVPTLTPSISACKSGGDGGLYSINFKTGAVLSFVATDAPIVGINVVYILENGKLVPKVGVVTSDNETPELVNATFPPATSGFQNKRAIWRELIN